MKTSYLLKRFIPYYKNHWHILVFDLICASVTAICEVIFPLLVRFVTDAAINDISLLTTSTILKIGVFYILLRLLDVAAYFYMDSVTVDTLTSFFTSSFPPLLR